jgi:transposase-like protein
MATKQIKPTKQVRTFSEEFKKEKVKLISEGKVSVLELSRIYQVSVNAVYKWIAKYSTLPKTERIVVEKVSESAKNVELMKKIGDLERVVGKQQLKMIYLETVIECSNELTGEDFEKKYKSRQSK